jgi:hypothetical protein
MGSPISGFIAEIFLQDLENLTIKHIIQRNHITFYIHYVHNILIIYDHTPIISAHILHYAKTIHTNLQLKHTLNTQASIKFLDVLLHRFQI